MSEPGGYSAGSAFLSIVPSFRGVQDSITREAAQWGATSGRAFTQAFNDQVRSGTNVPVGPSQNQSRQQGQQSGRTFADSFKARVDAALRSLPDVQIDADASPAEIKIAELRHALEDLSNKRVGVDIDASTALAEIDRIKAKLDELGSRSADVTVQADTMAAAARLEEIQQQVRDLNGETADVNVDDNGSVSNLEGKFGGLAQALVGLSPLAAPVGAALVAGLAGALETVGALAAGMAVLASVFSSVSGAVKLLGQQQQQSAAAGAQASRQQSAAAQRQVSAANQIQSAEQSLADARRNAAHQAITSAEQVANAEQSLADARRNAAHQAITSAEQVANAEQNLASVEQQVAQQRRQAEQAVQSAQYSYRQSVLAVTQAEQALMAAREAAQRQLEAYANAQTDSKLSAQQAQLDLQTAEANYQSVMNSSTSTDMQKQQAALDLAKARQALKEANQSATQAEQDNSKAQKEGVNGSPQVVSASQQVIAARHAQTVAARALAAAERAVAQAQTQGARQIAAAQQQVADAVRNQSWAQQASAEQVAKAQQQVADATRSQAWAQQASAEQIAKAQQQVTTAMQQATYASQQAGSTGSTALANLNAQIAKLSPAVLAFARYWRSTWSPIIKQIRDTASANLLPGVRKGLDAIKPMLPAIERFVGSVATVLGRMAAAAGRAFNSPFWQHFLTFMTRNVGPLLMDFGRILGNVVKGFAGLMEAFGPITRTIGGALVDWSRGFAQFGASAKHSAWFRDFIDYVRRYAPAVVDFFGNLLNVVGKLVIGLAPLGGLMVTVLDGLSKFLAKLSPNQLLMIAAAIGAIFAAFGGPVVAIIAGAVAAAALIANNWSKIQPAVQPVLDFFRGVWQFIVTKLVPVLQGVFRAAWAGIKDAIHSVSDAIAAHRQQLTTLWNAIKAVIGFIVEKVLPVLGPVLKFAFELLGKNIALTIKIISWLVDAFGGLRSAALAVAHWFSGPFVDFFVNAWHDVTAAFSDAWDWVKSTWSDLWSSAKTLITTPIHAAQGVIASIWATIKSDARAFVGDMRTIWGGLEDVFKAPIKFLVQYVLNDGLIKAWDWVAGHVPGMGSLKIPAFRPSWLFADGGVLPGYAPGVDSIRAMLSPGEAVLRPEVTRALGPDTIHGWNAAARGGRLGFANGGVIPGKGPVIGGPVGGGGLAGVLGGLLSGASGLLSDVNPLHWLNWLKSKFTGVLGLLDRFNDTAVGRIVSGVPGGMAKGMLGAAGHALKSAFAHLVPSIGGPNLGPVIHSALIKAAFAAAGVPDTAGNEDAVNIIVSNESGWDPTAVNRTDSNWLAGHPSVGLMQTINSTFQSWVTKALRNIGPFAYGVSENPLANMVAGIRYAIGTYGSLENVPGVVAVHNGQPYVGYDAGGLLEPGYTQVWNGTGKAEVVAPRATFDQIINHGAAGGGVFEGNLYLEGGEFLGRVRGETNAVIDKRVGGAQHAALTGVPGGLLGALNSPHARAVSGGR